MPMHEPKDIDRIFREGVEIDRALKRATREALRMHKALGNPVAVWRDEQVVWLQPDELDIPDEPADV